MNWIADTNVISELVKPSPNRGVSAWLNRVGRIAVSVISIEEIYYGLSWRPRPAVLDWYGRFFVDAVDVLPVTAEIARRAGEVRGRRQAKGRSLTASDMLIAGTALVHGLTLATRDTADFEGCGIPTHNPFS